MNRGNNFFIFFLMSCCVHLIVGYVLVQSSFHVKIEEPKIVSLELIQIDNVTNQTGTKHKSNAFNQSKPNLFAKNLPGHSPIKGFRSHNAKQLLNNFQAQNMPTENNSNKVSNNSKSSNIKMQTLIGQSQTQQSSQTKAPPKKISSFAAKAQEFEQKSKQNTSNAARKQSFSTRKSVNIINNASKNNINYSKQFHSSEVKKVSSIAARAKEFEQKIQDNSTNIHNDIGNQVSNSKLSSTDKNKNTHELQNNNTDNAKLAQQTDNLVANTQTKLSKDVNDQSVKDELQYKPITQVQSKIATVRTSQDSQTANIVPHDVKKNAETREQEISTIAQPSIKKFDSINPQLVHDTNIETKSTTIDNNKTNSTFEHNTIDAEKTLSELPAAQHTDGNIKRDDHEVTPQAEQKVYLQPEKQIQTEQTITKLDKLNTKVSEAEKTQAINTLIEKNNDASTTSSPQNINADTTISHDANNNAVTALDTNKLLLKSETISSKKINQKDIKLVNNAADTTPPSEQFIAIDAMLKISNNSKQQFLTQTTDNINPDVQDLMHNRTQSLEAEPHDHVQPESNNKQLYNKQMAILSPSNSESNTDIVATEIKNHNKHSAAEEDIEVNKDSGLVLSNSNIKTEQSKKTQEQQTTKTLNAQQTNNTGQAVAQNKDVKSPNSNRIPNNLNQKTLSPTPSSGNPRMPYSASGPFHKLDVKSDNSISYADTIRTQIQTHWNHTIGAVPGISVIFKLTLQTDGNIKNIEEISAHCPGNNTAICKAFIQNTKRSIWAAAPLQNLPIDKYELWEQLTFEFAPESH